jgi:hypothetical protein
MDAIPSSLETYFLNIHDWGANKAGLHEYSLIQGDTGMFVHTILCYAEPLQLRHGKYDSITEATDDASCLCSTANSHLAEVNVNGKRLAGGDRGCCAISNRWSGCAGWEFLADGVAPALQLEAVMLPGRR